MRQKNVRAVAPANAHSLLDEVPPAPLETHFNDRESDECATLTIVDSIAVDVEPSRFPSGSAVVSLDEFDAVSNPAVTRRPIYVALIPTTIPVTKSGSGIVAKLRSGTFQTTVCGPCPIFETPYAATGVTPSAR